MSLKNEPAESAELTTVTITLTSWPTGEGQQLSRHVLLDGERVDRFPKLPREADVPLAMICAAWMIQAWRDRVKEEEEERETGAPAAVTLQ